MGQKIHPIGFRLSVLRNWSSKWYANSKAFPGMLQEDIKVRESITRRNKTLPEKNLTEKPQRADQKRKLTLKVQKQPDED